ncbi:hypothetical protein HN592_04340 [Candidatus Woesearchaeota archaeon]|jgi:hypothetical protein|nr:hypothetical protein [Candidatus Woesearchaeota archaeon]MBT4368442.1 hypothetical protein [Candidatus Woesearchaeota archaeon]MBT4712931.1 hypothetical protein [Candidatus Woesearchaeota archaeon]MBT6639843.1 hypothetical protein [Candidatus Woesearchaeota archaeon]MBT7134015.1 hypothetical protein [Candidatus Woesearchaeota archaeon]
MPDNNVYQIGIERQDGTVEILDTFEVKPIFVYDLTQTPEVGELFANLPLLPQVETEKLPRR